MSNLIRLEPARPGDAGAIVAVHHAAIRGTAVSFNGPEVIDAWAPLLVRPEWVAALAARIASGEEEAVIARAGDAYVAGFGSIVPALAELRAVDVDPAHGRAGTGGLILRELERRARGHGLSELRMHASLNAEAFYRRHGYEVLGFGEHVLRSSVRMRKAL